MRTSTMPADMTKQLAEPSALSSNLIQTFSSDGFQVGNDNRVNGGVLAGQPTYYWIAFKSKAGHMALGSYTGTAGSQAITGLGFSPEYVIDLAGNIGLLNEQPPVQRMAGMTRTFPFDSAGNGSAIPGTGTVSGITSLDSDGFTVGTSAAVSNSGTTYYYAAWNQCAGEMKTSSYTGNGASGHAIAGVGFQPKYAIVRANDTTTARQGVHRSSAVSDPGSLYFQNATDLANGITSLTADGFQVGTSADVNNNATVFDYVAFNDKP
jgi:hypothetical protein